MSSEPLSKFGLCPNCAADWDAGSIFDALRPQDWCKDKSDEELQQYIVEHYSPPYHYSHLIGISQNDRIGEYACPNCNIRWPRSSFYL